MELAHHFFSFDPGRLVVFLQRGSILAALPSINLSWGPLWLQKAFQVQNHLRILFCQMDSFIWSLRNHIGLHHFEGQVHLWIIFLVMTANMLCLNDWRNQRLSAFVYRLKARGSWKAAQQEAAERRDEQVEEFSVCGHSDAAGCHDGLVTCAPLCAFFLTFSSLSDLECLRWCCHTQKKDAMASRKFVEAGHQANAHPGKLAMEHGPFEDVFPIGNWDIPLLWLCYFTRGQLLIQHDLRRFHPRSCF